jgi:predicted HD phosphohydrolase
MQCASEFSQCLQGISHRCRLGVVSHEHGKLNYLGYEAVYDKKRHGQRNLSESVCRRPCPGMRRGKAVLRHVPEQTLRALPDRLFAMLRDLSQDTACNITRYDHCLQAATRALRDGKDEEYVAVALLHDVCEPLGPFNHGEVVAAILRPFIGRDNHWMLVQHGLFQTYFYARHMGLDPNARDIYKSDPAYEQTVEFCAKYDEVSFDPDYKNEPLSTFEPMVRRLLQKSWVAPSQMKTT